MSHKNKTSKNDNSGFPFIPIAITSTVSTLLYFLFIIIFALIALKTGTDSSMYMPVSIITGAITGFICGFVISRITKSNGLLYGGLTGFIHSVFCSVIIFLLNKGIAGNGIFLLIGISFIASSLGGISAVNIKKKIKY
jgi:putative membrane protein (TIGR04086 family)